MVATFRTTFAAAVLACLPLAMAQADIATAETAIAAGDYAAGIASLQPLVDSGDGYATWKLAEIYLDGHGGSFAEGVGLLQKAAEAGEPDAQARLGVMYAKGDGVAQNDIEAFKWLSLASRGASRGVSRIVAETNRSVIGTRLNAEQRAAAMAQSEAASAGYQATTGASVPAAPEPEPETTATATTIEPIPEPMPGTDLAGIRLQLAAVTNEGDVDGEWARLRKRYGAAINNLELHVERADLGSKGIFYRLQAGPFADRSAAAATCGEIRAAGGDCLIVGP
jgi:cell division septation protein DedD